MAYVTVNLRVKGYTNRVLGVLKEMYGLNDKGKAMDKFAELYGGEFVEASVKDNLVRDIIRSCDAHVAKHGFRETKLEDLRKLCEA
jgi:hypothetical protein